jgi:hypothetical protein
MQKWMLSAAMLGLVGCAQDPAVWPDEEGDDTDIARTFELRGRGGQVLEVNISDSEITGPNFNLGRYVEGCETTLRGFAFRSPVDLKVTAESVKGIFGSAPLNMSISVQQGTVRARGLVGGYLSDFSFSARSVRGTVGGCSYDFVLVGRLYEGYRSCGMGSEEVWMQIPVSLGQWTQPEVAASLGIFLSTFG